LAVNIGGLSITITKTSKDKDNITNNQILIIQSSMYMTKPVIHGKGIKITPILLSLYTAK